MEGPKERRNEVEHCLVADKNVDGLLGSLFVHQKADQLR